MRNPFTLSFGKEPNQCISRLELTARIIEEIESDPPVNQVYMITGVRGSGKTVLLTEIAKRMEESEEWIVVDLVPVRDMLQSLASKLYSIPSLSTLFTKAKLNLSAFGMGVSIENVPPVTDIETVLSLMLTEIRKKGKKVLITVDEVYPNEYVKVFVSVFQSLMRKDYPIFLLMTGLYENILDLQDEISLTFLYRAPRIMMGPLNISAVANRYNSIFKISMVKAKDMANLTRGYPFAFQVLGYLYWNKKDTDDIDSLLPDLDHYLEEFVYEKIWSELSEKDKQIVSVIAASGGSMSIKDIRESLQISSGEMSVYRNRLNRKGIIDVSEYGKVSFYLPRLEEIVNRWNA